uniref:Uncharacterized protein n=1 Tax=Roseihalotalea indica TaxID=2867963 RepID=A0AA49GQL5_9BACT|nr:hypothetical protein K4G66_10875 [Tunicatimonas sp. TK19036]
MKRYWIFKVVVMATLAILALSAVVMLLWNWLIPRLLSGPTISLWEAMGLLILSRILFGNFGRGQWGGAAMARKRTWERKFKEKWEKMTPEEREQFKATMKNRCSSWGWMPRESTRESTLEKA